jgi:hypothetical protein
MPTRLASVSGAGSTVQMELRKAGRGGSTSAASPLLVQAVPIIMSNGIGRLLEQENAF